MRLLKELLEQYDLLIENDVITTTNRYKELILSHFVKMIMSKNHQWFVENTHRKWFVEITQGFVNKIIDDINKSSKRMSKPKFTAEKLKWWLFGDPYVDNQTDFTDGTEWEVKRLMKDVVSDRAYADLGLTKKDVRDDKVAAVKKILDEFYPTLCDVIMSKAKAGQRMTSEDLEKLCKMYGLTE